MNWSGWARARRIGALTARSALRATVTHFRGRAERWLDVDRESADVIVRRMREERPDFLFAAFTGVDKASHARGHDDALVLEATRRAGRFASRCGPRTDRTDGDVGISGTCRLPRPPGARGGRTGGVAQRA